MLKLEGVAKIYETSEVKTRALDNISLEIGPGEFVWREAGSVHEACTDEGAVILAVFRKPNVFLDGSGFDRD